MSNVIGIDLGTTNTCVAILDGGQPRVLVNSEGSRTTPSMVAFGQNGQLLVGQAAKRQMVTNAENTLLAIKRLMGRRYDDPVAQDFKKRVSFAVEAADNGDAWARAGGKQMSPAEVSALVLQKMKQTAETFLGETVTQAVITVPAYFNDAQRQATRDAGRIAGLEVLRIVNEPTAAALAFGLEKKEGKVVAVYDLGGGTFDISILEIRDGLFQVKATNGDTHLGGVDFDQCVINDIVARFEQEQGIDLRQERLAMQRIREAAENARIELSTVLQTDINLPFIHTDAEGPKHLSQHFSRARLEALVDGLIQRSLAPCQAALQDAGLSVTAIDEVILVGGMTRMPKVQQAVAELFGRQPHRGVNPDEVVAMGAAVQAGVLSGELQDVILLDVTPFSLGIRTKGGGFSKLIQKNEPIPCKMTKTFTTVQNWQTRVTVMVAQGEAEQFADNRLLGEFELEGLPLAMRGVPRIDVTFAVDVDGLVKVSAQDKESGLQRSLRVTIAGGLTEEDLQRLTQENAVRAQEEVQQLALLAINNKAEALLDCSSQLIADHGEHLEEHVVKHISVFMADLRSAVHLGKTQGLSCHPDQIVSLTEKLQEWYGEALNTVRSQEVLALEAPHRTDAVPPVAEERAHAAEESLDMDAAEENLDMDAA
ncbi:MAG: molecular chaperone DnaK, partial [Magnetococcales bacterium]|nr:molecular chaperone DnaK [Magnetococcales bacterium]